MIRDLYDDFAVLQNGYWRLEIDLARPRVVSLRADPNGQAHYCQEILEPGFGRESILETPEDTFRSRNSGGHQITSPDSIIEMDVTHE